MFWNGTENLAQLVPYPNMRYKNIDIYMSLLVAIEREFWNTTSHDPFSGG